MDHPRRSRRTALAVLPLLVALVTGCSSSGGKTQPADGEVTTSSPAMMTGAQMEQLQNALAAGAAKGPLSTSTTAVPGDTSSTAAP